MSEQKQYKSNHTYHKNNPSSNHSQNHSSQSSNQQLQQIKTSSKIHQPQNFHNHPIHFNQPNTHISNPLPSFYLQQHNIFSSQPYLAPQNIHSLMNNMFATLMNQSKLLTYLAQKNQQNASSMMKICDELSRLKKGDNKSQQNSIKNMSAKKTTISEDITADNLISILYNKSSSEFNYRLIVDNSITFQNTLYKQRNFKLKIILIDQNDKIVLNINPIPISLALYTMENPPKFLQCNTSGNKMLKGHTQEDLINGTCYFQKIQIKQVTSHYRKGMVFLVAFSKMPSFSQTNDQKSQYIVNYKQIRPLVIDKIIVKAKKAKQQTLTTHSEQKVTQQPKQSEKVVCFNDDLPN